MVSFSDHADIHVRENASITPKHIFTFINGAGDTRKIEATNITDAWVNLSFREEAEVEELVEQGWRVKFR